LQPRHPRRADSVHNPRPRRSILSKRKKILIWVGAPFAVILLALVLVPVLFKDRIAARARAGIERAVDAHVDWRDAGLTFFRNFPNVTLTLDDLTVRGTGSFEGDTLAAITGFRFVLDLGSVLFGDRTVVRSIDLQAPSLNLIVLEDGTANWDILREKDAAQADTGAGGGLDIELRRLAIRDGRIVFDNRRAGLYAALEDLDHTLRGDFSRERFTIRTQTRADSASVRFAGVPYLERAAIDVTADIDADMANRTFTFGDNVLRLNELELDFTGSVSARAGEDIALDITFASPQNEFRSLLSLVPAVWSHDFASLQTAGRLSVNGHITGSYGENAFPALALQASVDSASFRYPDLPLPARDIFFDLAIDNPGGDADSTVVNLRRLHARIGDDPINATMVLRTPVSDPAVDLAINGTLDLGAASRTFVLENVQELSGVVNADVAVQARKSDVTSGQYARVAASGDVVANNVILQTTTLPKRITVPELALGLSPRRAELRVLRGTIGNSDVLVRGWLDNLIGFVMGEGDLRGSATLESQRFDLTEWQSEDEQRSIIEVPPRIDVALNTSIVTLHHGRLDMTNARGVVHVKDRRLTIDSLRLGAVGGELRLAGFYETTDPTRPTFDVDVAITNADVAQAFEALTTVKMLAPVAGYAEGSFSTSLHLDGPLADDLTPVLAALTGRGTLQTTHVALQSFPLMDRLADALHSTRLRNPTLRDISTAIEIRDGRLHVRPFEIEAGNLTLMVGGSNGIDRSLDYQLIVRLPQSSIESDMRQALSSLFARAGEAGGALANASIVQVAVQVGGTIDDPSIELDVGAGVRNVLQSLAGAARASVDSARAELEQRVDTVSDAARRQAEAAAQRLIAEAEQRANVVREEARRLAETIRREAYQRADSLVARATSTVARLAAERAADRIRREADERATGITTEADSRADAIVAEARLEAARLRGGGESTVRDTSVAAPAGHASPSMISGEPETSGSPDPAAHSRANERARSRH
jgi:hypothetical protein